MDQRQIEPLRVWIAGMRGRQAALAASLGVRPSVVAAWVSGRRPIPSEHGASIEGFTGGAVTRRALFPADWLRIWPELANPVAQHQVVQAGDALADVNSKAQEASHA